MVNLKFEGEIAGVSERQLEFVSSVLAKRGFTNTKVLVSVVGKVDDNFGANVKRFVVEKDGETFKMVAKIAASNEITRSRFKTTLLFLNEHVMYTYVLPKFTGLEKGADIPESERFRYAECYGSLSEEPNEIILLEDLQLSEFATLDKNKSFTDGIVKLVLKNLARFHSLSYTLKNREPETYEIFKNKLLLNWPLMIQNEQWQHVYDQVELNALSVLDNAKHKSVVKGNASRVPYLVGKNYKIDRGSKYSVIQQGDPWINNIMFTLEANNEVQCCMIDYQLANENSPVADLHYMIFNCTDYETRSKNYHEWIDYYHDQLNKCLDNFGLKANFVYPRDQLDADLRRFGKYSFGVSLLHCSICLVDAQKATQMKEDMQDENRDMGDVFSFSLDNVDTTAYKSRVIGVVNSFLELGYIV